MPMSTMSTTVRSFQRWRRRSSTACSTAGIVPVDWRIPKTPPMMKMKKMMSAAAIMPRGIALRKPSRPTGFAAFSASPENTRPRTVRLFGIAS